MSAKQDAVRRRALEKAISIVGSQNKLAAAVGVRQSTLNYWVTQGRVPPEKCALIEEATGGEVTRVQLRPEIYGSMT